LPDKYEYIVNRSRDFITLINRDYVYEIVNDTYCKIIGLDKKDVLNKKVSEIWGKDRFESSIKGYLDRCFQGENVHYIERFKFGLEQRYMHVSYYPYGEVDGEVTHALVFSHDITKLGEIETKLINYQYRDPMTGLYNRRSLEIILDTEISKARRSKSDRLRAILFIGIENLSEVHRKYGASVGNVLLENTGVRLKEALRNSDYVFRYEGDELVVILSILTRELDVGKVATKLLESVTTPYRYKETDITLDCHIGAAVYPNDAESRDDLVRNALSALDEAVHQKEPFLLYDTEVYEAAVNRIRMEGELQHAFENGEFELYYQPIVDLDGRILGSEALIRWNSAKRGLLSPAEFIPLATETGIIELIGKWALFAAVRQLSKWTSESPVFVSVNLTAREFESDELPEVIEKALAQAPGIDPSLLKVEITESECMSNPESAIRRISAIRESGTQVYIDDFGTGQSSLAYLKNLPVDAFKIDRTFIQGLLDHEVDRTFLQTIILLVKSRNRKVILEGIGTEHQLKVVKQMPVDGLQGFHFSRPVPAQVFHEYLSGNRTLPVRSERSADSE